MLWEDFSEKVISELRNEWRSQPWIFQTEGSASAKTLGYVQEIREQKGGPCSWSDREGRGVGAE